MLTRRNVHTLVGEAAVMIRDGAKDAYEAGLLEGLARAIEVTTGIAPDYVVRATHDAYLDGSEDIPLAGFLVTRELDRMGFFLPS